MAAKKKKKKSTAKLYPFNDSHKELFKDVVYLVEANHNETHLLWERFHYKPVYDFKVDSWVQVMEGYGPVIGELDNRPICVGITYAILNGKKVMFYEGQSEVVDYKMIEDWRDHYAPNISHCNATNFGHCLNDIGAYDEMRKEKTGAKL